MNHLLDELNSSQREAAQCINGPMMVIAGAGSGKTRTLSYRIAYMISQGINPFNILTLTFTNKAADEMKDRIIELLGNLTGYNVWMGTYHSVFCRILRSEGTRLGYSSNFTIYDTDDAKSLIKLIIKEMNLDDKIYKPGLVLHAISQAKSNLISVEEYIGNQFILAENTARKLPDLGTIYQTYNNRLKRSNTMDFDDLLFNMYLLLRDHQDVLYKYQNRFKYILIDEYQDTNHVQYHIIKKLAELHENICVVGDDAQSIYAFRGANIQNILNFRSDYPDYNLFKLEQNYRSSKNILAVANSVIKNNVEQIPKEIWTDNAEGEKTKVIGNMTDREEAQNVVKVIEDSKNKYSFENKDFTILYRTNAQSRSFEEFLRRANIPYRIYGGISFYKRKEIKDILAYYRLTINPNDDEALRRIINYPQRGIGLTTFEKIMAAAKESNCSFWEVIDNPQTKNLNLNAGVLNKLADFVAKIKSYQLLLNTKNAFELGKYIADTSGITSELRSNAEEIDRYENLGELFSAMKDFSERIPESTIDIETGEELTDYFPSLDRFLNEVALLTDADEDDKSNDNKVKLMTIHSAKGLEFPFVFVVGMEEKLFPSHMVSSQSELEEERRLFYVSVTRAKQHLVLSYAQNRFLFGNLMYSQPSRFLYEIDEKLIEIFKSSEKKETPVPRPSIPTVLYEKKYSSKTGSNKSPHILPNQQPENIDLGEQISSPKELRVNQKVFHDKFGVGTVNEIIEDGMNSKTVISFEKFGVKTMLLRFAKLKPVNEN